jgi:hypothetical protein
MQLRDLVNSLIHRQSRAPRAASSAPLPEPPTSYPDSPDEPAQITNPKVLLIIFDPTMDPASGKKLAAYMGWSRPDDLVGRFIADLLQASAGLARYQIVERVELDEFPALVDGFRYTPESYLDVMRSGGTPHTPPGADYHLLLTRLNVLQRVQNGDIDEVWIMGFPHAGLYESVMAGMGAFWCNAPPLPETDASQRRFVVMGFSYERDIGEMLHSFNHRCEAILAKVFDSLDFLAWAYKPNRTPAAIVPAAVVNPFQRFMLFDQIAPGKAAIGSVHYPPNAVRDYDVGNPHPVPSECYDWLKFPEFRGDVRMVSASEWGGGSERGYQRWWLNHMPKSAGRKNGIHNNWWQYVSNVDNVRG